MAKIQGGQDWIDEIESQVEAQIVKNVNDLVNPTNEGYPVDPESPYAK